MKSKLPSRPKTSGERAEIQLKANATRYFKYLVLESKKVF